MFRSSWIEWDNACVCMPYAASPGSWTLDGAFRPLLDKLCSRGVVLQILESRGRERERVGNDMGGFQVERGLFYPTGVLGVWTKPTLLAVGGGWLFWFSITLIVVFRR